MIERGWKTNRRPSTTQVLLLGIAAASAAAHCDINSFWVQKVDFEDNIEGDCLHCYHEFQLFIFGQNIDL